MNNIPSFRMLGRAKGLGQLLLQKYNLATSQSNVDPVGLLVALAQQNITDYDRNLCLHLAQAAHADRQQGEGRVNLEAQYAEELSGEQEAKFLFGEHRSDYATYILADTDYMPQVKEHFQKIYRHARRVRWTVAAVILAVVLGIVLYNLPYFAELRAFGDAKEVLASSNYWDYDLAVDDYFREYPDGAHAQEVVFFALQANEQQERPVDAVKYAGRYLHDYPAGKYTEQVEALYNRVWDAEIARFDAAAASRSSQKGVRYVQAMLAYMRDHHVSTVDVRGVPTLELKEYSDYPAAIREAMEYSYNAFPATIRIPDDLVTIRDRLTPEEARGYTSIIVGSLQEGFDRVLTPGFITFEEDAVGTDLPQVTVNYTISTQEENQGLVRYPSIWEYSQTLNGIPVPSQHCYLLGIEMMFDADFSLPGTDESYNIVSAGKPGEESFNVTRSQAYEAMCRRCTQRFSETIAEDLGIGWTLPDAPTPGLR